jgi:zinc/manganese transport system substrate-binding protein/manganese/iron transport system substrate-binding protein
MKGADLKLLNWSLAILCATLCGGGLLISGCGDDDEENPSAEARVVTTLPLFAEMAKQVGGDRVQVDALLPAGADPHTFEPVPSDIQLLTEADIVFANGLGLEEATIDLIDTNLPSGVPLVELAEEAEALGHEVIHEDEDDHEGESDHEEGDGHDHEGGNPHMWLDPEIAKEYANIIQEELSLVDPEGAAIYGENYESYWDEIDDAEMYLVEKTLEVSEDQRVLVTTHDAFPYLARAIGYEVGAVVTVSPGQETDPQAVAELSRTISETGISAVFKEPQLGSEAEVLEQAASDAGVDVCVLYSDSLDDEVQSYTDLVRHNADEIAECLGA